MFGFDFVLKKKKIENSKIKKSKGKSPKIGTFLRV